MNQSGRPIFVLYNASELYLTILAFIGIVSNYTTIPLSCSCIFLYRSPRSFFVTVQMSGDRRLDISRKFTVLTTMRNDFMFL
jgi:hypothetical protein